MAFLEPQTHSTLEATQGPGLQELKNIPSRHGLVLCGFHWWRQDTQVLLLSGAVGSVGGDELNSEWWVE